MEEQEQATEEYHENPFFNNQYHQPVWVQIWSSDGTNELEPPDGVPITCAICGLPKPELLLKERN